MERDLFVSAVAFVTGSMLVLVSLLNQPKFFEFRTPAALSKMVGRIKARCIIGLVGGLLVGLSFYIISQAWANHDVLRNGTAREGVNN
jgi:hypothetical protein